MNLDTRKSFSFNGKNHFLELSSYADNGRLALLCYTKDDFVGDITINLPMSYIHDCSEGFINAHSKAYGLEDELIKLGIIEKVVEKDFKYNMGSYDKVKFNIDLLEEYDPMGYEEFTNSIRYQRDFGTRGIPI